MAVDIVLSLFKMAVHDHCVLCYHVLSASDPLNQLISLPPPPPPPGRVCCAGCSSYYRHALVYVPGGASMLALVGLVILAAIIYWRSRQCSG
jgi:hypothetical protein